MKKIITILILQVLALLSFGQANEEYEFVVIGLIGISNSTPVQDAIVELNKEIKFSDENGKVSIKTTAETINVKIDHIGYSTIDSTYLTKELGKLTELFIMTDCQVNRELALSDIKKNEVRLLLTSGIAPVHIIGQEKIEEKYSFKYQDFGCVQPLEECIEQYNNVMFRYLDERYGKSWRKEVRKDIVGLKAYKLNNRLK